MARLRMYQWHCWDVTLSRSQQGAFSSTKVRVGPVAKSGVYNRTHCPADLRSRLVSGGNKRGLTVPATSSPARQASNRSLGELRFIPPVTGHYRNRSVVPELLWITRELCLCTQEAAPARAPRYEPHLYRVLPRRCSAPGGRMRLYPRG
jgi:hypothetical protein